MSESFQEKVIEVLNPMVLTDEDTGEEVYYQFELSSRFVLAPEAVGSRGCVTELLNQVEQDITSQIEQARKDLGLWQEPMQ